VLGVKVTLIAQSAPAAKDVPQPFDTVKSPTAVIDEISSVA
jgi:hypothetical protein